MINENYGTQPCAAMTLCPVSETALCCGSLVLQRATQYLLFVTLGKNGVRQKLGNLRKGSACLWGLSTTAAGT